MKNTYQIIQPKWLATVNSEFQVLTDHVVILENERIAAIKPQADLDISQYPGAEVVELPGHVLMPGLVNAHTHASMSLFRGLGSDVPLMEWLQNHIWPAESQWVSGEFVGDGLELACAEMIRSGTTCINDMYFFSEVVAEKSQEIGMRSVIGLIVLDFPTVWAQNADEYINKGIGLYEQIKELPLVTATLAPHAPYTVSDGPLEKIAMYSNELELPVHMHVHETAFEVQQSLEQFGKRPLERLDGLNLVNSNLLAVHMTQLNEFEIERIAEAGVSVAHCPESNLKLSSGTCPVASLLERGVNVSIGTDGAASNDDLDMLTEMRTASLLAKVSSGDASSSNVRQSIEMATINGARAIGLDDKIGSIETGKLADLIAIDLYDLTTQPVYDPLAQVVYAANSRQVSDVWINGVKKLSDFELTDLDVSAIRARAESWAEKIRG